jgi:hypothetical protein
MIAELRPVQRLWHSGAVGSPEAISTLFILVNSCVPELSITPGGHQFLDYVW